MGAASQIVAYEAALRGEELPIGEQFHAARHAAQSERVRAASCTWRENPSSRATLPYGSVVYFIAVGGLIKIGTTINIRERIRHLAVPTSNVITTHPGSRTEEQALHRRFTKYREYGEWFRPGSGLIAYVEQTKVQESAAASRAT